MAEEENSENSQEDSQENESVEKQILESVKAFKEQLDSYKEDNEALKEQIKELKESKLKGQQTTETKPIFDYEVVKEGSGKGAEYYAKDNRNNEGNWLY